MLKKFKKILPGKDQKTWKKIGFWLLTLAIGGFFLAVITVAGAIAILSIGLPDVTDIDNLNPPQSTEIYDKEGNLLRTIHGEENREQVPYERISQNLVNATVAIEDDVFWEHGGFDFLAIGRAALYEVFGIGSPRGGSTITQQYAKNAFLSSERSYTRKIREAILALRLENAYSKEEILGLYLNRIPYGNNAYGCQKAAEIYFEKDCADLDLAESSVLAALPQAPSRYNPFGENKYSHLITEVNNEDFIFRKVESEADLKIEEYTRGLIGQRVDVGEGQEIYIQGRSDLVLKRMADLGTITQEERQEALNKLQTLEFSEYKNTIEHPHFVFYIKQILEDKYGKDVVEQGGLKVYTTIDPAVQDAAEQAALTYGDSNESRYGTNNLAILSVDPKTGHILAMIGSRDYFNEEIDGNVNVVNRPRQPGSSFKPFVFAKAFYNGYAPGSVVHDIPTRIGSNRPQNYDGQWSEQMTIREALGKSRNIPAIKAYFLAGEQDEIIDLVEDMGITSLNKSNNYGYPLALGAGEVSLAEMVTAYGTFANNGKKPELTGILRVENANGDILEEWQQKEFDETLDPQIAYLINSILSDREAGVGPRLFISGKVNAAKTGTSTKENKQEAGGSVRPSDAWTIGYTPSIVTGVWTGNTDGTGLNFNANGYDTAAPIFNSVMTAALANSPAEPFPEPEGIVRIQISKASGKLPGPDTPQDMIKSEVFASFSVPTQVEDVYFQKEIDRISGKLATEFTPEEAREMVTFQNYAPIANMLNWAAEIREYYKDKTPEGQTGNIRIGLPPTEFDDVHTAETAKNKPVVQITSPSSNTTVPYGTLNIITDIDAPHGIERVEFYLDDKKEFFTTSPPYNAPIRITQFLENGSAHLIVAKVIDKLGYSSQSAIQVRVSSNASSPDEEPEEDDSETLLIDL